MTWLFVALALLVVAATALALAGRWNPSGLAAGRPPDDAPEAGMPASARFGVVLRGYRMDEVDAELDRLHRLLEQQPAQADDAEVRIPPTDPIIEP